MLYLVQIIKNYKFIIYLSDMPQLNNRWCVTQPDNYANNSAQINTAYNVVTTSNNTIEVGITASTITFDANCRSFILAPSVIPTAPVFVRYYTPKSGANAGTQTTATTTTRDRVITGTYPAIQEWRPEQVISMSLVTATTQTLYLSQLG